MISLDDLITMRKVDPDNMLARINELPQQVIDAWKNVSAFSLPSGYSDIEAIVVLGMGGSAIGGDLVGSLTKDKLKVPLLVSRDYDLPAWVGPKTLVIASSYSGNTEETLTAVEEAAQRGARILAVTTGGKLGALVSEAGYPVLRFKYMAQPRAAIGHSFILLLGLLQKLGMIDDKSPEVEESVAVLRSLSSEIGETVPSEKNIAKQLAWDLFGRTPIIYGSGIMAEVAHRWKTQFNENSKAWAFYEVFPELNHNAVVGYEKPPEMDEYAFVVFLTSSYDHFRNQVRMRVTQEILKQRGVKFLVIGAKGQSALAQMLSQIHFGDLASYYLAMLYRVNPSPVEVIDYLKRELANIGD